VGPHIISPVVLSSQPVGRDVPSDLKVCRLQVRRVSPLRLSERQRREIASSPPMLLVPLLTLSLFLPLPTVVSLPPVPPLRVPPRVLLFVVRVLFRPLLCGPPMLLVPLLTPSLIPLPPIISVVPGRRTTMAPVRRRSSFGAS